MQLGFLQSSAQPEALDDPEMPLWDEPLDNGLDPLEEIDPFDVEPMEPTKPTDVEVFDRDARNLSKPSKRRLQKLMKENRMRNFLQRHGFAPDLSNACRFGFDDFYPLHLAAREGDHEMVRMLLNAGAPATQTTFLGQTALEIAQRTNRRGSHDLVIATLQSPAKTLSVRQMLDKSS